MKSSFLFLTFISLTIISISLTTQLSISKDPIFLELSKKPSAEAIFLAMNVQLQQGDEGFERILGLLTQLIEEAKDQLHSFNMIYAKSQARCDVTTTRLAEQAEYYSSRSALLQSTLTTLSTNVLDNQASIEFLTKEDDYYTTFLAKEIKKHLNEQANKEEGIINLENGLKQINDAIDTIKHLRTQPSESQLIMLETATRKVMKSYMTVKKTQLVFPMNFNEIAGENIEKTKLRLIEWFSQIKVTYEEMKNSIIMSIEKSKVEIWEPIEKKLKELSQIYESDKKTLERIDALIAIKTVEANDLLIKLNGLIEENNGLGEANYNFCILENQHYMESREELLEQVQHFKSFREYFLNNYSQLSEFIKEKYKRFE